MKKITNPKLILITGAYSGFGKDTAIALAKRGHNVIATTHTENEAKELSSFVKEQNLNIKTFKLDTTLKEDREKVLEFNLDVLINNAGTGQSGSLAEIPLDRMRDDFETNIFSSFALSQLVLKKMIARNSGTVIFVSSMVGRITMPFLGSYSMTKFALSAGAEAMRAELYKITKNVHVSLIEPGAYHTGFNQENIAKMFTWMNESSYFYKIIDKIKKEEEEYFEFLELKSTKSIVKKFVKASEARKPKLRYTAPLWQAFGIQVMRILGK